MKTIDKQRRKEDPEVQLGKEITFVAAEKLTYHIQLCTLMLKTSIKEYSQLEATLKEKFQDK